jgi:hypothetical protein
MSRYKGLYKMPQHHLYGTTPSGPRPNFNTMSFMEPKPEPEPAAEEEAAPAVEDVAHDKPKKDKSKIKSGEAVSAPADTDEKVKKKKKKKRSSALAAEQEATTKATVPEALAIEVTATTSDSKEQRTKKKKSIKSLEATVENELVADATTNDTTAKEATANANGIRKQKSKSKKKDQDVNEAEEAEKKSAKKRKRDGEVRIDFPSTPQNDGGHEDGGAWLRDFDSRIGTLGADSEMPRAADVSTGIPAKKKAKTKRKTVELSAAQPQEEQVRSSPDEPINQTTPEEAATAKKDLKRQKRKSIQVLDDFAQSAPPSQRGAPRTDSPYVKEPNNTPIPPPPNSSFGKASVVAAPKQRRPQKGLHDPEVLVLETPPAKRHVTSSLPQNAGASTGPVKTEQISPIEVSSASESESDDEDSLLPKSAPAALPKTKIVFELPSSQASLTTSNLNRYTQPLSDQAKPRPCSGRSSSVSSASSLSIKDAFARVPKPLVTNIESNPFLTPISRKKVENEVRHMADAQMFNSAFQAFATSVNMIDEQVYLNQHLDWRTANDAAGPLPCLKSATGCNSKAEQHIRVLKENTTNLLQMTTNSDKNQLAFEVSVAATIEAEKFLQNAVATGIPVPTGNLEGKYTLYCPKYAETHADKYGFGLRELYISKPAGFNGNTYTARLVIPPRPVAYRILSFDPPPNASFRTTKLTASAEGYTMDLVVLGNGYILLRVDVGLFLTGKRTVMGGDSGQEICMEFFGMKEEATKWSGIEDIKTAKEKDRQRITELAEKAKAEKIAKDQAWIARKEEMALEKERLKAGTMYGVESSPVKPSSVAPSPVKPKSTTLSGKSTPRKPNTTTTNGASTTKKPKAGTMAGISKTPTKLKAVSAATDGVSPSPKKRGRPTNAELIRRAIEKEAMERVKA